MVLLFDSITMFSTVFLFLPFILQKGSGELFTEYNFPNLLKSKRDIRNNPDEYLNVVSIFLLRF